MKIIEQAVAAAITVEEQDGAKTAKALAHTAQSFGPPFFTGALAEQNQLEVALTLFGEGNLPAFTSLFQEKNLTPNLVLPNGLTLLQNSLDHFPRDKERLHALLTLGANPNFYMCPPEDFISGFQPYRAGYHPLNNAFARFPQETTAEICKELRRFGADIDAIKYYREQQRGTATPDDADKAALRQTLIAMRPDEECLKKVRKDVDLSLMRVTLSNLELHLKNAGLELVEPISKETEAQKSAAPTYTDDNIGELIPNKGIYMGSWTPVRVDGSIMTKSFYVFAAPETLGYRIIREKGMTYSESRANICSKLWYNIDGLHLQDPQELYTRLAHGPYSGEWFIPPLQLVTGRQRDGTLAQSECYLFNRLGVKSFSNIVTRDSWYWSLDRDSSKEQSNSKIDGGSGRYATEYNSPSDGSGVWCIPMRVEPV